MKRFVALGLVFLVGVGVALADDYDFEDFARRTGCDSVIFSDRRRDCSSIQANVDRYCKTEKYDCSIGEFKKLLGELNDTKNRSTYNDDEKKAKDEKLEKLRRELDVRKTEATRGLPIAEQCVRARTDIFDHFRRTSDMTATAGKEQMALRQKLIDRLRDAEKRRDDAKNKRDATPNDDNLKREYEKVVDEFRKVEQELAEFNRKNGKDIERNYTRLVDGYTKGNEEHKTERESQSNRRDNCKEISSTSY